EAEIVGDGGAAPDHREDERGELVELIGGEDDLLGTRDVDAARAHRFEQGRAQDVHHDPRREGDADAGDDRKLGDPAGAPGDADEVPRDHAIALPRRHAVAGVARVAEVVDLGGGLSVGRRHVGTVEAPTARKNASSSEARWGWSCRTCTPAAAAASKTT